LFSFLAFLNLHLKKWAPQPCNSSGIAGTKGSQTDSTPTLKLHLLKLYQEPVSKRFSLVNVKAGENFNRMNTLGIFRIKI